MFHLHRKHRHHENALEKLIRFIIELVGENYPKHKPIFALTTTLNNQTFIMANINLVVGTNQTGVFTLLDGNLNPIQGVSFSNQVVGASSNPEFATFALDPAHANNVIATPVAAGSGTVVITTDATYNDPVTGVATTGSFSVTKNFTVTATSSVTFDVTFS